MGSQDHLFDRVRLREEPERLLTTPDPRAALPLERLFKGASVVVEEAGIPAEMPDVSPEERAHVMDAVPRRRMEFATGRWCARRALARLGIESYVLRAGPDREPQWPVGIVGSITHTGGAPGGYCGVVIAQSAEIRTVGVDAESSDGLDPSLWRSVLTPTEQNQLQEGGADPGERAKVIFSAKECFYKAQFPLNRSFLDFIEVEVTIDNESSTFEARVTSDARRHLRFEGCSGRYLIENGLVLTGIAVRA